MSQQHPNVSGLISLGNALLHFGIIKEPWDQHGAEFQDLVKAASGADDEEKAEKLEAIEKRWKKLSAYHCAALEVSKEWATKHLDKGAVIGMPIWDDKAGLHYVLLVGHTDGQLFKMINRHPETNSTIVGVESWEAMGFRRWNVPVAVYTKKVSK